MVTYAKEVIFFNCLSVCLLVTRVTQQVLTDLAEIFC